MGEVVSLQAFRLRKRGLLGPAPKLITIGKATMSVQAGENVKITLTQPPPDRDAS